MSINAAIVRVDQKAAKFERTLTWAAKLFMFACFLGSVAMAAIGVGMDLDQPIPGIGIALTVITVIPSFLQTLDWLWPHGSIGAYRTPFRRMRGWCVRQKRRRDLARLFSAHGKEMLAVQSLPTGDAAYFSIAAYRRRKNRRRRIFVGVSSIGLLVSAGLITKALTMQSDRYEIGQEISLDGAFSMTVLGPPRCGIVYQDKSAPSQDKKMTCQLPVQIHNTGHFVSDIGPGAFMGPVDRSDADYMVLWLLAKEDHYDFIDASFPDGEQQPDAKFNVTFIFAVPNGVSPDGLSIYRPEIEKRITLHK